MLLRASRVAEGLTKEGLLGSAGRFALKHWKPIGGTALVGALTAPSVMQASRKAKASLNPRVMQAQKYGLIQPTRAGV